MKNIVFTISLLCALTTFSQKTDEQPIKSIFDTSLSNGKSYDWLNYLSNQIGGRLSGSVQAQQAVDYTKKQLEDLGLDKVILLF